MKRIAVFLLVLASTAVAAQENLVRFGDWIVADQPATVMDEGFSAMGIITDEARLMIKYPDVIMVTFPEYIGAEGTPEGRLVFFASDKVDRQKASAPDFMPGPKTFRWHGEKTAFMIHTVLEAAILVFRTYGPSDFNIDATFQLNSDDSLRAWKELERRNDS
jgi:hypothetical protein